MIITYWSYNDALIQTYTLPYVRIIQKLLPPGSRLTLVTLENKAISDHSVDKVRGELQSMEIDWVYGIYEPFGFKAVGLWLVLFFRLLGTVIVRRIDTIHVWAMPAGVIGYVLAAITRSRLIIDSYEPHAEAMIENGTWRRDSMAFKILFFFERLQSRRANYVVSATAAMKDYAMRKYNTVLNNFTVKPACVDLNLFSKANIKKAELMDRYELTDKIVCVYAGKFGGIYLKKEVFDFLKVAHGYWGDRLRILLLTSHSAKEIGAYCKAAKLDEGIVICKFVPHAEISDYLGLGDFAITPVKSVPTKRYCTPIKDGEYWALGLPVVISAGISDDSDIIEEHKAGAVIRNNCREDYQLAVEQIDALLQMPRMSIFERIRPLAEKYRDFSIAEKAYRTVYAGEPNSF